jgi:signal transduction histidine kinase
MKKIKIKPLQEGRDISERKRDGKPTLLINALLEGFVRKSSRKEFLDTVVDLLSGWTGCRYGGIRVADDYGNIPYESYKGFSQEFWEAENPLSIKKDQCVCIRVITGKIDPQEVSMVTPSGSFWSNNTFRFIEGLSAKERERYRGTCVQSGFASVAVIPIRNGEKVLGTIHLADDREDKVPLQVVELIESLTPLIGEAVRRFNLEDELRWDHETQKVINWIMGLSFKDISLEGLLERALERILSIPWLPLKTMGAIFLVEEDPEVLAMKTQIGLPDLLRQSCSRVPFDRCLCGQAARTKEIQFANHLEEGRHDPVGATHPHGHYCVPMLSENRVLGVIDLYLQEQYQDDEKKKEFLQILAKALVSIIERKRAEEVVRESEKQLRTLSSQLLTIQENERKRLAKELHDGVGQTLAAVKFGVENTLKQVEKKAARHAVKTLEAAVKLTQSAIEEIRKIATDLRPSLLDDLGILVTINWFYREVGKIYSGIRFEKRIAIQENEVPHPLKIVIYRVMQEALNNAVRHSGSGVVFLSLIKNGGFMELTIKDQGSGFELDSSRRGLGLTSMKERVELSSGVFAIETTKGKGTVVQATWPL